MGVYLYTPYSRTPWANTLAYYPLAEDCNDYSGNNRHGTNSNVTFSDGIATFNGSNAMVTIPSADRQKPTSNFTISAWARPTSWTHTESWQSYFIVSKRQYFPNTVNDFLYALWISDAKYACGGITTWGNNDWSAYPWDSTTAVNLNERNLYTLTNNWTTKTLYLNWNQIKQATANTTSSSNSIPLIIGNGYHNNHYAYFNGNISNVILENKTWTSEEISNYYNTLKSNYWIS